jgi:hypothetical protein
MYSDDPVRVDTTVLLEERSETTSRVHENVACWYGKMAPYWTTLEPPIRKRLVLCVHQWIAESAFVNGALRDDVLDDLGPGGRLAIALTEVVPGADQQHWRPWIRATLRELRRCLGSPPALQTEAWWRRLFLGPSYMRAPVWRPRHLRSL